MNTVTLPGFTAEESLGAARGRYRSGWPMSSRAGAVGSVVPAIPYCGNCDYILDWCARLHSHAAICSYCAGGYCWGPYNGPPL
jgi:hypothetical protein